MAKKVFLNRYAALCEYPDHHAEKYSSEGLANEKTEHLNCYQRVTSHDRGLAFGTTDPQRRGEPGE